MEEKPVNTRNANSQRIPPCRCPIRGPFKITLTHDDTPCICLECEGAIPLNELEIPENYRRELVAWHREFRLVHALWREAGVYSAWARQELHDVNSPINESGRILVKGMPEHYTVYYVVELGENPNPKKCIRCGKELSRLTGHETAGAACSECSLLYPPSSSPS
ncbi:MAG: DUF2310 family Zn-ribbon-containing protein [Planctomycetota bacterium]|jgi:hypothetical protein